MAQFMLIHGASHGAWCWERVVTALEAQGHQALATDQPGMGSDPTPHEKVTWDSTLAKLSDDLLSLDGPVILVGHSMGGTLTAQLTEMHSDKVSAAVYLAATLPRTGESCLSNAIEDCSAARIFFAFEEMGLSWEDSAKLYPLVLFGDCADVVDEVMPKLGPQPMSVFDGKVALTDYREGSVPRYFIETLRDLVITPGHQRAMYTRRPCKRVYSLQSSHSAMYSAAEEVATILDEIAISERSARDAESVA